MCRDSWRTATTSLSAKCLMLWTPTSIFFSRTFARGVLLDDKMRTRKCARARSSELDMLANQTSPALACTRVDTAASQQARQTITRPLNFMLQTRDGKVDVNEAYQLVLTMYVQINRQAPIDPPPRPLVLQIFCDTIFFSRVDAMRQIAEISLKYR